MTTSSRRSPPQRPPTPGRGRRPGGPDTRGQILDAARASFAERGFVRTTIRGVAGDAGVDPALVHHYFGSKDDLFLAALEIPVDPRTLIPQVFGAGTEGAGQRLVSTFLRVWDRPDNQQALLALVRTAFAAQDTGELLRGGIVSVVLRSVEPYLDQAGQGRLRATLVASQLAGLIMARYVLRLEPLASLPADEVAAWVGPNVQRYIDGPFPD